MGIALRPHEVEFDSTEGAAQVVDGLRCATMSVRGARVPASTLASMSVLSTPPVAAVAVVATFRGPHPTSTHIHSQRQYGCPGRRGRSTKAVSR